MDSSSIQNSRWAVILGGSSGFGLASAFALAADGFNLFLIHRDRKGAMGKIQEHFDTLRGSGVSVRTYNTNALVKEGREDVLNSIQQELRAEGVEGRVHVLLHSIAFGNLKLLCKTKRSTRTGISKLASVLHIDPNALQSAIDSTFQTENAPELLSAATPFAYEQELLLADEEILETVSAMGVSLLSWTRALFERDLFTDKARVLSLTSEGNEVAWLGYAAVSAAKATLEAISRSIAKEFGPHGLRCNVIQPGVTDTQALRCIPGNEFLKTQAFLRNPLGRLTTVDDVAAVVSMLAGKKAEWINGSVIRVDGGEHISA